MLKHLLPSPSRVRTRAYTASGSSWLVRHAVSAGLVTRIRSGASCVVCAHDKTADFFVAVTRFVLALLLIQSSLLWAATPPNTAITNTASANYTIAGTPVTVTGSATVTTAGATPATIAFLQYVPSSVGLPVGMASLQNVPVSQCNAGSGFLPLPAPVVPGGPALPSPGSVLLAPGSHYASGDPVFGRVIDYKVTALVLLLVVSVLAMIFNIFPVLMAALLSALIWRSACAAADARDKTG